MKVKFYGVRGSLPVCGKEFERYGGNTTCIRIFRELVNRIAIIDAGTGIRNLGKEIINEGVSQNIINILFSHFHWDHTGASVLRLLIIRSRESVFLLWAEKEKLRI